MVIRVTFNVTSVAVVIKMTLELLECHVTNVNGNDIEVGWNVTRVSENVTRLTKNVSVE